MTKTRNKTKLIMTELKGKLKFISLWDAIELTTETGVIDLRDYYFSLFEKLNNVKSKMEDTKNSIEICADENSERMIKYKNDGDSIGIWLENEKGYGSNIGAYLPNTLQTLNGRQVILTISNNGIKITNNPDEKVFGLYYTRNNCCKIADDKVKEICKAGTSDACIFCSVGGNGFECLKFDSPSARMLLDRYSKKQMKANRIGDCEILGRKETN